MHIGAISSVGEHYLDTVGVTGSIPVSPTTKAPESGAFSVFRIVPMIVCCSFVAQNLATRGSIRHHGGTLEDTKQRPVLSGTPRPGIRIERWFEGQEAAAGAPSLRRPRAAPPVDRIYCQPLIYTDVMAKHLIDVDESMLGAARAELGTQTIKDTVNDALSRVMSGRECRVVAELDVLAEVQLNSRDDAWR